MLTTNQGKEETFNLFDEYVYLSNLTNPNTSQQERLLEILEEAVSNSSLDELISQFEVAMLDQEDIESLLNEQAKLREHFAGVSSNSSNKKSCDHIQHRFFSSDIHRNAFDQTKTRDNWFQKFGFTRKSDHSPFL